MPEMTCVVAGPTAKRPGKKARHLPASAFRMGPILSQRSRVAGLHFKRKIRSAKQSTIRVTSVPLSKSPISFWWGDEAPFTPLRENRVGCL